MRLSFALVLAACSGGETAPVVVTGEPVDTNYDQLPIRPLFQWTDATVNGLRIRYHLPENLRGVVFVFHGTNGDFATVQQAEWIEIYNAMVPQGLGIVLTESTGTLETEWDNTNHDPDTNVDFQRLKVHRQFLIDETAVEESTPVFSMGFSAGGGFAALFGELATDSGWDMRAFVLHNSHHFYGSAPGFYVSAENDFENGGPQLVAETAAECTTALGAVCPHAAGREIPLDPRRFARLAAFDLDTSAAVWEELRQLGYIDDQGNRLVEDITDMDAVMAGWESTARTPSPGSSSTQIRVVWATHRVTGEFAQAEAAWLVDHL